MYLPSAPSAEKEIKNYTTADVIGCIFTDWRKMPNGHPCAIENRESKLRTEWPGARVAASTSQFMDYLLLAPDQVDERILAGNIYRIIQDVMDLPKEQMASAILAKYDMLSEKNDKISIAKFCGLVFPCLLDVRLLVLLRDCLNDDTVLGIKRPEGLQPVVMTVRGEAKIMLEKYVLRKGFLEVPMSDTDYANIYDHADGEEATCNRLKQWLLQKWAIISVRVTEVSAGEILIHEAPALKMFDPR